MSLFDLAFARQQGGQFILRIEDTDQGRYVENSEQEIYDTLRWLRLEWDEGPDKGGPYGPYRQSERLDLYQGYARQLIEAGHAYECWCTPERLAEVRAEQSRQKLPPRYDRFCVGKTRAERAREEGFSDRPVVRMLVPESPPTEFDDVIRGRIGAPAPDDQVILKSDGFPTYHLAVVVDDHHMAISHVTRGEEWISSTPKHLLLYEWLGWEPPKFAHFPLLRNPDRSKISKRKNPAARLRWFREQGYLPEALLNFLALMGWSMPDGREIFSFQDLVGSFAWERFSTVGPIFDLEKFDWLNNQYLQAMSDAEFARRAQPFLPEGEEDAIQVLAPDLKSRTKRFGALAEDLDFLYVGDLEVERDLLLKQKLDAADAAGALRLAESVMRGVEPFEAKVIEQALFDAQAEHGLNKRAFLMLVRIAVTGKTQSPPIDTTIAALGRDRTLRRLTDAAALLEHNPVP
jgi:glutamyl-tRNA synthetase